MTQVIEIENGLVRLVERHTQYSVPLAEWIAKIEKRSPIKTPVLPTGTRAVYWDSTDINNQTLTILIEREPHIMHMDYGGEIRALSVPWTRFFFICTTSDPTNRLAWNLSDYRVFWSKNKYTDPAAADMIAALLPNVYDDGRICFGSTGANADQSLAERLDQTVNEFFVSRFNDDLHIRRPNGQRTYRQWMRMTENNPTGWLDWPDWDPNQTRWTMFSFDSFVSRRYTQQDRFSPMIAAEPIPDVPLGATFGRLQEWLDGLDQRQRNRLMVAMLTDRALHNERYEDVPEIEEDEDGDE